MRKRMIPLLVAVLLALTIAAGALETRVASPRVAPEFSGYYRHLYCNCPG